MGDRKSVQRCKNHAKRSIKVFEDWFRQFRCEFKSQGARIPTDTKTLNKVL